MIAPRWVDAHADRALRGVTLAVYDELWRMIDPVEYRPVKLAALCHRLRISENAARPALAYLVSHGYLERGPKVDRIRCYRLVWELRAKSA